MNRESGAEIEAIRDEVEQSIDTILGTEPGARVMRADYGTDLLSLVDMPANSSGRARVAQAVAEPLRKYEPRLKLQRVTYGGTEGGELTADVHGTVNVSGERVSVRKAVAT